MAQITVEGEPKALERSRKGKQGHWYDPSKDAKDSFAAQCLAQWRPDGFPSKKNFCVNFTFYCGGQVKDFDNLMKFVADSLQGFYWVNDRQIKRGSFCVMENAPLPRTVLEIDFVEIGI